MPAAVALARVSLYPLFYGVRASFTHYLYGRDFGTNGLTNYRNVWNDTFFRQAMVTTAKYVVCTVTIETLLGVGLALLVSREIRFASPIRVGLILPMTIAPVVVGVMWRLIYDSASASPIRCSSSSARARRTCSPTTRARSSPSWSSTCGSGRR